jgi:acetoin utilization deacetylase AcuC-like enzyme
MSDGPILSLHIQHGTKILPGGSLARAIRSMADALALGFPPPYALCMLIFYSPQHILHRPQWYVADGTVRPCPEVPQRAELLIQALAGEATNDVRAAMVVDPLPAIRAIHTSDYLNYLESIHKVWSAEFAATGGMDVLPDTFPRPVSSVRNRRPGKPAAQAGYYCFDMAAPITAGTWQAALESARCAVAAADALLKGGHAAYALCRPPGHHAGPNYCGGFCYINNAAAAAQYLRQQGHSKVALLDIDYHHGNGTQDIFYNRDDVLFLSLHADPNTQYPYFWGYPQECGEGPGEGFTCNFPLPRGTSESAWLEALEHALARIRTYAPTALVVSLGLDISQADPVGDFRLSRAAFAAIGRRLSGLGLPTAIIQEGGYNLADIGPSCAELLRAFDVGME